MAGTDWRMYAHTTAGSGSITNISVKRIGAVAEYDGSGMGEKIWGDKSGNDLHGTVSGATLENTPYDSGTEYEEGTWTIVCSTTGVTVNTSYDTMAYTKIGRLVNVYGRFRFSVSNSPDLDLGFTGLPFTTHGSLGEDANHPPFVAYMKNAASSVDNGIVGIISGTAVTAFQIVENCTTGAGEDVAAHVDTGTLMAINLTYFTT